jgi:ABC-type Mn2+/Zn2+ transport system ATPase subunit
VGAEICILYRFCLKTLSFELKTGEFITLIGPNGAGKSSLIKILLGLIIADHGNIKKSKDIREFVAKVGAEICILYRFCLKTF